MEETILETNTATEQASVPAIIARINRRLNRSKYGPRVESKARVLCTSRIHTWEDEDGAKRAERIFEPELGATIRDTAGRGYIVWHDGSLRSTRRMMKSLPKEAQAQVIEQALGKLAEKGVLK